MKRTTNIINYNELVNRAIKYQVIKNVLADVADSHPEVHFHLLITFATNIEGVVMSESLHKTYPIEMTIVLQRQFADLKVHEDRFSVKLRFAGVEEAIEVPFEALIKFFDPANTFVIEFTLPKNAKLRKKEKKKEGDQPSYQDKKIISIADLKDSNS